MATSPKGAATGSTGPEAYKVTKFGELKKRFNALVDLVFATQPLAGSGLARNDSPLGRLLSVIAVGGGKGGSSILNPWQGFVAGDPINAITFYPGTLNGLLPSNIFSTFTIDATSTWYIHVNAVTDGKKVTSCSIVIDNTASVTTPTTVVMGVADTAFTVCVGVIVAGVWSAVEKTNLDFQPRMQFVSSKGSLPFPGAEPFDRWWRWQRTF